MSPRVDLSGVNGLLAFTPLPVIYPGGFYATTNFLEQELG